MVDVAISQDDVIAGAIEGALRRLDVDSAIRGKLVAVKPNETWASEKDKTGVTQADTLQAVLRYLKRFNPRELLVTGGAGAAETEDVMRFAGMLDVIKQEGVELVDHNRPPFEKVELSYEPLKGHSGPQKEVYVNRRVLEYETIVSLAQLKLHETATVTLCLKNIAMSFPAADYYGHPRHKEKHANAFFDDMHSFIAAMVKRFPITLGIIAGHPAMIATGPLGGFPVETGLVIASRDAVAADTVGAKVLGFNAQGVRHLWEAGRVGLGETDISKIKFPGHSLEDAIKAFTKRAYGKELDFQHA